jgi:primary-amine oxidase
MTRRLLALSKFNNETKRLLCVPCIVRRNISFVSAVQSKYLSFNKICTTTTTTLSNYKTYRNVWTNGLISTIDSSSNITREASSVDSRHPLHSLTPKEITQAASVVKDRFQNNPCLRFVAITLLENNHRTNPNSNGSNCIRAAEVLVLNTQTGIATEVIVNLLNSSILKYVDLPPGTQPMLTPDDCFLAENIVKQSKEVQTVLMERYGITDVNTQVAADPWSVHLADDYDRAMTRPALDDPNIRHLPCRRLVQTFLYQRTIWEGEELQLADNHYAHPIDVVPVVDLNTQSVVKIDGLDRVPPPKVPQLSVNYHRSLIQTNSYLQTKWRHNALSALNITQPDGPSFTITDNNCVTWQNWSLRVGFNYREGLVLHDVTFDGRQVLKRASLVEMAVPVSIFLPKGARS